MQIKCPQCGVNGSVSNTLVGKKVRCPKCMKIFPVTDELCLPVSEKPPLENTIDEVPGCVSDSTPTYRGMKKHKDISRIDQIEKRTHGWYVRIRVSGKTHSKFFSDGKHSSQDASLLAAITWRDETKKSLEKVQKDHHTETTVAKALISLENVCQKELSLDALAYTTEAGSNQEVTEEKCPLISEKKLQENPIDEISKYVSVSEHDHPGITAHKGISRIDHYGWYVRGRVKGEQYSKFFPDSKFSSKDVSLLAAIKWRDETEITLSEVQTDHYTDTAVARAPIASKNLHPEKIIVEIPEYVTEAGSGQEVPKEKRPPVEEIESLEIPIDETSGGVSDTDLDPEEKSHKDIARIDQIEKRTHGWYVRVRFKGKTHSKFFSDGKCNGKGASLLAAVTWRDETEKSLGKVRTDRHIVTISNSSTGEVGIRFNYKLDRYEVSWVTAAGKQGKTSVSVRRYGKDQAFEIAQEIRRKKEAERLSISNYKRQSKNTINSLPAKPSSEPLCIDQSMDNENELIAISNDTPSSITIRKKVRCKIEL